MSNLYESHYGVSFINLGCTELRHSFRRFGLYPTSAPSIESADAQINLLEAETRDGFIDLSELGGVLAFKTRKGKFEYKLDADRDNWAYYISRVMNELHGRRMYVVLDDAPTIYYTGRLRVSVINKVPKAAYITIEGEFDWLYHSVGDTFEIAVDIGRNDDV